jgi:hypothetical protein
MFRKLKGKAAKKAVHPTVTGIISEPSSKPIVHSASVSNDGRRVFETTLPVTPPRAKRLRQDTDNDNSTQLIDWTFGEPYENALADVAEDDLENAVEASAPTLIKVEDVKARRRYLSSVSSHAYL